MIKAPKSIKAPSERVGVHFSYAGKEVGLELQQRRFILRNLDGGRTPLTDFQRLIQLYPS